METALPKPPPPEHLGSATTSAPLETLVSRSSDAPSRPGSASISQTWQRPNSSRHRHSASLLPTPRLWPPLPETQDVLADGSDFMTALAAQERRVLELKDELRRAEDELTNLKKQWAMHEATKRRNEGRRLHQMRPMSVSSPKTTKAEDTDGSSAWMYEEMERRKALMGHARTSSRRVFSGSRHAKRLSLIPPMIETVPPLDAPKLATSRSQSGRSKTTPDLTVSDRGSNRTASVLGHEPQSSQKEVFEQGRQLATEWKDGLWTFFEDLKQATVGDAAAQAVPSAWPIITRKSSVVEHSKAKAAPIQRSSRKIKPDDDARLMDMSSDFWKEHGIEEPKGLGMPAMLKRAEASQTTPARQVLKVREFDGESWETWDSPEAKGHSPAHSSDVSTAPSARSSSPRISSPATSNEATPRVSIGSRQRDSIPWPALTKLGPANLRRTASHLMDEWERSLSPSSNDGEESKSARSPAHEEVGHEIMSQIR